MCYVLSSYKYWVMSAARAHTHIHAGPGVLAGGLWVVLDSTGLYNPILDQIMPLDLFPTTQRSKAVRLDLLHIITHLMKFSVTQLLHYPLPVW